jgi:hypothetical protein
MRVAGCRHGVRLPGGRMIREGARIVTGESGRAML